MDSVDDYTWSIALPYSGTVVLQRDYHAALLISVEMHKMGVHVPLLREPLGGGPYEEVRITYPDTGE